MKLISVNIETDNHFDRVFHFIKNERPDVLCLQEVFECDLPLIEKETGLYTAIYTSTMKISQDLPYHRIKAKGNIGIAILSAGKPLSAEDMEYGIPPGAEGTVPVWDGDVRDGDIARKAIIAVTYSFGGREYKVITTHFTWSAGGVTTDIQRSHMKKLLDILSKQGEFVLCGDLNAPRGREMWQTLASRYTDNIPQSINTTIDSPLHKIAEEGKTIMFVVDGMFSTSGYKVSNVRVVDGVSDHMAIIGEITRL